MNSKLALGVDVGNAKVKLCVADAARGLGHYDPRWISRPLPYDDRARYRRHEDFELGLPAVLDQWLGSAGMARIRVVVAVTSSGYAYPTFREGVMHTMQLLARTLPGAECLALAHDGMLVDASAVALGTREVVGPLMLTNGMGAAHLARRVEWFGEPRCGVVVDTGGSTSQVIPFVDGVIDPAAHAERPRWLEHRLRSRRSIWVGTQTTPLEALAHQAPVGPQTFPVIPRGVTFDAVASVLALVEEDLAEKLSLFGLAPSRVEALRALADSVSLDLEMTGEAPLVLLARHYLELAIDRLASELRVAFETIPERARRRALAFGLGAQWLTIPALVRAGIPGDGVAGASRFLPGALSEIASCYGACHLALERIVGGVLPVDLRVEIPNPGAGSRPSA